MPTQRPAARLFLLGAQRLVADRGASGIEAFLKARFVPDDAGRDLVRKLLRRDEVFEPNVLRVHADPRRRHVHQPFHDEG